MNAAEVTAWRYGLPYQALCPACGRTQLVHHSGNNRRTVTEHYFYEQASDVPGGVSEPLCPGGGQPIAPPPWCAKDYEGYLVGAAP